MARLATKKASAAAPDAARALRHRLTPGTALRDLDDAAGFLEQMGVLLQTPHPYLPSLFGAAQGKPYKPGVAGFGHWPAHAWHWAGELAERDDVLMCKVLLGQRTLVHRRLWQALDSAVRELEPVSVEQAAIVQALRGRPSLRTGELRALAGFEGNSAKKRYDKALTQLQWSGSVICTPVLADHHQHAALADLWSAAFPKPLSKVRGPADFVKASMQAAGSVPLRELLKWFNWPKLTVQAAIAALVSEHQLRLVEGMLVFEGG